VWSTEVQLVVDQIRQQLVEGRVRLAEFGAVVEGRSSVPPFVVLDADGVEVEPISSYLRDRTLHHRNRIAAPLDDPRPGGPQ
jgi:hypothetical protein